MRKGHMSIMTLERVDTKHNKKLEKKQEWLLHQKSQKSVTLFY